MEAEKRELRRKKIEEDGLEQLDEELQSGDENMESEDDDYEQPRKKMKLDDSKKNQQES